MCSRSPCAQPLNSNTSRDTIKSLQRRPRIPPWTRQLGASIALVRYLSDQLNHTRTYICSLTLALTWDRSAFRQQSYLKSPHWSRLRKIRSRVAQGLSSTTTSASPRIPAEKTRAMKRIGQLCLGRKWKDPPTVEAFSAKRKTRATKKNLYQCKRRETTLIIASSTSQCSWLNIRMWPIWKATM